MLKSTIYCLLVLFFLNASAQKDSTDSKKIIQLFGVVFASDSNSVIPGVHVYVPTAGRGTTTNPYGFFSMPVQVGDSLVFSSVGYKRNYLVVPEHESDYTLKTIVTLQEDVTFLDEVSIFPYPTEEMFKQAVLALESPNYSNWLDQNNLKNAYRQMPVGSSYTQQYYYQMQYQATHNRYAKPQNNLLNPWAWAKFINTLKDGK